MSVTDFAYAKSCKAVSKPAFPPPMTATSMPLKRGPSQEAQYVTPLFSNLSAPWIFNFRRPAPEAMSTAFAENSALVFVVARNIPSLVLDSETTRSCVASITMSPLTASRCVENDFARSVPLTSGEPIQFSIPSDTPDCPPISSAMKTVFNCLRAAYTPAATPAGPPPPIIRTYINTAYSLQLTEARGKPLSVSRLVIFYVCAGMRGWRPMFRRLLEPQELLHACVAWLLRLVPPLRHAQLFQPYPQTFLRASGFHYKYDPFLHRVFLQAQPWRRATVQFQSEKNARRSRGIRSR